MQIYHETSKLTNPIEKVAPNLIKNLSMDFDKLPSKDLFSIIRKPVLVHFFYFSVRYCVGYLNFINLLVRFLFPRVQTTLSRTCLVLFQHGVINNDTRLQDINVKGDLVESKARTRSEKRANPDQWTSIPVMVKILKLLLQELASNMDEVWLSFILILFALFHH